jgi:transposase
MAKRRYPSDLTDKEWAILQPLLPPVHKPGPRRGRPRIHTYREIMNAIACVLRSGGSWRMLPKDLPPWQTAYFYFRKWRIDGTWENIHTELRERTRIKMDRSATPSAAVIDSQSVRTSEKGGSEGTTDTRN